MRRFGVLMVAIAALSGCKPHNAPVAADSAEQGRAVSAAETAVRADIPSGRTAQFRGETSYDQALPGRRAVCGQVSPYADDEALFVPFVAVMTRDKDGSWSSTPDSRFIGTDVAGADRTYLAIVAHCYEKGGPSDGPVQSVAPLPPAPNEIPHPSVSAATPAAGGGATMPATTPGAVTQAGGTVTLKQNANLHATPQGASTRVVPGGTALRLFATAPGGWDEVGDDAPWGWVHESMLVGH